MPSSSFTKNSITSAILGSQSLHILLGYIANIWKSVRQAHGEYQWRAKRYQSRKQLLQLDDHQLRDIGISRGDAMEEASKDFWD